MAVMQSKMIPLGTPAPAFALPDAASGNTVRLEDFGDAPGLLVAFICNHCPYVKHILDGFVDFARDYGPRGLGIVAICPNDAKAYPADSPPEMAKLARARKFNFPYLVDESQAVARAYTAVCTPDFFLFDQRKFLAYRGQFDDSRPGGNDPVTGRDLRAAAEALLTSRPIAAQQFPSAGCSIKWKRA